MGFKYAGGAEPSGSMRKCECLAFDIAINMVNDGARPSRNAEHGVVAPAPPASTLVRMRVETVKEKSEDEEASAKEQEMADVGRSSISRCFLRDVRWSPALSEVYDEVANAWHCQRQCQLNTACAHFTYSSLHGECTLHGHRAILHQHANPAAGYVSGPQVCLGASSAGPISSSSSAPQWLLWLSSVLFFAAGICAVAFLGGVHPALWSSLRGDSETARGREVSPQATSISGDDERVEIAAASLYYLPIGFHDRVPTGQAPMPTAASTITLARPPTEQATVMLQAGTVYRER
eukprot:NODE_15150_length_1065_cov_7.187633.p1 GENE.NODE_15150_length_1065_cov_7.187633~~NODE_15150_length_1065_cov_7.187633.p1  ORF type:complete len:310 (-),score=55.72 NODE_15150_length_1065_cov_7.187633:136-1011(-)